VLLPWNGCFWRGFRCKSRANRIWSSIARPEERTPDTSSARIRLKSLVASLESTILWEASLKIAILRLLRLIYPVRCELVSPLSTIVNTARIRNGRGCSLTIGSNSYINARIVFERPGAKVSIGSRTFIGGSDLIAAENISVGDDVLVSWDVTIVDHSSHSLDFEKRKDDVMSWRGGKKDWQHVPTSPIVIGNKAWIGFGATILKGISIGEGAVVGAKSVVTQDVEPWTIVAGNPARMIRRLERSPA
jgi:acetyltransferase-like isoleucine patch superfamily enzyme